MCGINSERAATGARGPLNGRPVNADVVAVSNKLANTTPAQHSHGRLVGYGRTWAKSLGIWPIHLKLLPYALGVGVGAAAPAGCS